MIAKDNPILEGENEELVAEGKETYRLRFDRNIQLFDGLVIDDKTVPEEYYDVKSGSTIIEIKPSFLSNLALGEHELSAYFLAEDEPLSTAFTITSAKKEEKSEKKEADKKPTEEKSADIPDTGAFSKDGSFANSTATLVMITIAVAISAISLAIWAHKTQRFKP